jgi:uncharacterized protein YhbP (UPF0306 family)
MTTSATDQGSDPVAVLREYVTGAALIQVATASSEQPWLAHVWYASDPDLGLYFLSNRERRHSYELRANPLVAAGIVRIDEFKGPGQTVRGVTLAGKCSELEGVGLEMGYGFYRERWPQVDSMAPVAAMLSGESPMRIYQIDVDEYVLFDELNFADAPRVLIDRW